MKYRDRYDFHQICTYKLIKIIITVDFGYFYRTIKTTCYSFFIKFLNIFDIIIAKIFYTYDTK